MKAKELQQLDTAALQEKLNDLLHEQMQLRMQHTTEQLPQAHLIREVRRNIARVKTILHSKREAS